MSREELQIPEGTEGTRPVVFVHTNDKQLLGARVSEFSLKHRSAEPDSFDIRLIRVEDYGELTGRHGQTYLRNGRELTWDNGDLQSFTPTRFLAPELMGFSGRALVIDPDVFAIGDVAELLRRNMQGKSIVCRRVEPPDGRPPYFASSVMLLNCEQLGHWKWSQLVDRMFRHELDYHDWINLYCEDSETIGQLEEEWNHFDTLNPHTKLLHNTGRKTQPWKTGLSVDFVKHHSVKKSWWASLFRLQQQVSTPQVYEPHPDQTQQQYFFSLLSTAIELGHIELEFVAEQVARGFVRRDAMDLLAAASADSSVHRQ
jgi:hypothetical protein